ncbi:MAG: transporter substrate-binding domain-containing protein, partial [Bacteroidales bacterium]
MNRKIRSIFSILLTLNGVVSAQVSMSDSSEFLNRAFFPSEEFSFFGTKEYTEIKSRTITIYGGDDYHPYEFINENGDPDGFNVDYIAAIMDKIGLNYDLKLVKWPILMDALKNKEIDMVTGLAYTEEREKYALFSILTFVEAVSYISSKESLFQDASELIGRRVSAVRGELSEQMARQFCLPKDIVLFDTTTEAFESVYEGRSDLFFGMNMVMQSMMDKKNDDRLRISRFNNLAATYSIAVNSDQEALLQLINMAILQLKIDGTYDDLCEKWFSKPKNPLLSRSTKIIIFSLLMVLLVAFIFIIILKIQISRAVEKEAMLNRNLLNLQRRIAMALEVGKIDAWMYDYATNSFSVVSGERLATTPGNSMSMDYFETHIHPEDKDIILEAIKNARIDGNSVLSYKLRFKTLKGWRWLFMAYTPIVEDGVITSLMGVRRDITSDMEYEQTLQKKIIDTQKHGDSLLSILDNIPTSIALRRIDTGQYSYSNKMAVSKFGAVIGSP